MRWPDPGEEPEIKTTILEDDTAARRAAELWAKDTEGESGSGTWTWWPDKSRTPGEGLGAAAVSQNAAGWTVFVSLLCKGRMRYSTLYFGRLDSDLGSAL